MPANKTAKRPPLHWLMCALILTGCAVTPPPTPPVVVTPPAIPSPPATAEQPTSQALWALHCKLMSDVRQLLFLPPMMSGPCSTLGP